MTISKRRLPKKFKKSSPKPNKSNIKINSFLTNIRTPVDLFIDNRAEAKGTSILHVAQFFTPQEAIK